MYWHPRAIGVEVLPNSMNHAQARCRVCGRTWTEANAALTGGEKNR